VLEERLESHIPLRVVEATVNDVEFARAAATTLTDLVRRAQHVTTPRSRPPEEDE
jgi:hypothetical protein